MPRSPIAYIDISFFAHATEDPEKVVKAIQNVVSVDYAEKIALKESRLKGDYGNPIILFKARIEEETISESFLEHVSSQLPALEKERLLRELNLHLEKGNLYLRFDKQAAFKGELRLSTEDTIRLRIRFRKSRNEEVIKICKDIGLLPKF